MTNFYLVSFLHIFVGLESYLIAWFSLSCSDENSCKAMLQMMVARSNILSELHRFKEFYRTSFTFCGNQNQYLTS